MTPKEATEFETNQRGAAGTHSKKSGGDDRNYFKKEGRENTSQKFSEGQVQ